MGAVQAKAAASEDLTPAAHEERSMLEQFKTIQARVDKVHVDGVGRTKDDLVQATVQPMFEAATLEDVITRTHEARTRLEQLGCFRSVGVFIDTSRGPEATEKGLEVTFEVQELRRIVGGINTLVGQNEGSLVLSCRLPNLAGRGEKLQGEYTYGTNKTTGVNLAFVKPFHNAAGTTLSTSVYQSGTDFPWSGFREIDRGLLLDLSFRSATDVLHSLRYDVAWREVACLDRATPFEVRLEAGHSLKSAVKHILTVDKRDSTIFPTEGALIRLNQELAGLGGNIGFLKHEAELQYNLPLPLDITLQGAFFCGHMKAMYPEKTYNISDRFFLGGPLNVRGFEMRGIGPQSDGSFTGADMYWAAAFHLYTPLPFRRSKGGFGELFRTHFFVNTGNIGNFRLSDDISRNAQILVSGLRLAYGIGVSMRLGEIARLELNYCVPTRLQKGDRPVHGLQFGVGVSFL
ncbi:sorting and assembly machinery component 50 homolog [Amphibalanus amphitrite]|uniref:sorting and assembly machinery component 50 homolog n=1 Tax=Amphibalanus amphitrite TaxID=1232801 RepID=UPI001C900FB0|nr:sorting and assembly machinery component 50 homolog [Amphibalanus amphitrite]XP_043239283.1 sorting and assembly machinery component 50 homolog [Amphibalanus amphitrite]XP_043239284.1 sorting and assembly machinery component 50 homolog [Amphibalanus amphitrite]XP_043239285.1 sorting and assembly machinery component 50 homolog [Amphibalanus amphitrite]XP_043239286.1 sorting and assembly machinery component 50 homolog [Amphibalanus amphitrite]XP_043239287.1 sorting and assembly machinery comp